MLWSTIEPLLRSALAGETRSREIWTAGQRHCLMVDVGTAAPGRLRRRPRTGASVAGGVAVVLDITARRRAELLEPRSAQRLRRRVDLRARADRHRAARRGRPLAAGQPRAVRHHRLHRRRADRQALRRDRAPGRRRQRPASSAGACSPGRSRRSRSRSATSTPPARRSRRSCRCRSCATATATPLHYVAQLQDISERKQLEEHLRGLADHDPLTGLRNRRLFEHDLKLQVARSRRYGEVAGLMVIDLDDFGRRQRRARPAGWRRGARGRRQGAHPPAPGDGPGRAPGRRRVRGAAAPHRRGGARGRRRGARPRHTLPAASTSATTCCTPRRASASRSSTSTPRAPSRRCCEADRAMRAPSAASARASS